MEIIFENNIINAAIFSDFLSALQCFASKIITVQTRSFIFSCKNSYYQIVNRNSDHSPKFYWIPAHKGIQGSEQADTLAKLAFFDEDFESSAVPYTDLKENFKLNMHKNSENTLSAQGFFQGKKYFKIFYQDSKYPWYTEVFRIQGLI